MKSKKIMIFLMALIASASTPILSKHTCKHKHKKTMRNQQQNKVTTPEVKQAPFIRRKHKIVDLQYNRIVIVTASYNNADWYRKNLESVFNQRYENYILVYIDDCSTDGTADLVEQYIHEYNQTDRVHLIKNESRQGALANIYRAIHTYCQDDDIVVLLDGDDWFKQRSVLRTVNQAYNDPHVWLTYGQMEEYPSTYNGYCKPLDQDVVKNGSYRQNPWHTSHLRTFYAWLFKQIKEEDFLDEYGEFWPMTWDMAIMFPLLEMAGDNYRFIKKVLYVYNMQNNLNDNKVNPQLQRDCESIIRSKQPYKRLNTMPVSTI